MIRKIGIAAIAALALAGCGTTPTESTTQPADNVVTTPARCTDDVNQMSEQMARTIADKTTPPDEWTTALEDSLTACRLAAWWTDAVRDEPLAVGQFADPAAAAKAAPAFLKKVCVDYAETPVCVDAKA